MKTVTICITMENGKEIKAELYPEIAPKTVENFVNLVKDHFYDSRWRSIRNWHGRF